MKRKEDLTFLENLYVVEVMKGIVVTSSHLLRNFFGLALKFAGLKKDRVIATYQYPDELRAYPQRYRGSHRLTLKDDGSVKCTSCFLCATACPAKCIYIEPAAHFDSEIEKFPHRYEIDTLLCVYCGYCVDACPVDAIRMDSGLHPQIYSADPRMFIEDKETLMQRSRNIEDLGREMLRQMHADEMKKIEKQPFSKNSTSGAAPFEVKDSADIAVRGADVTSTSDVS